MVMRRCSGQSPRRKVLDSGLLYTFFLVCIKTTTWRPQITSPGWICASSLLVPKTPLYNCSWEQVKDNGGSTAVKWESTVTAEVCPISSRCMNALNGCFLSRLRNNKCICILGTYISPKGAVTDVDLSPLLIIQSRKCEVDASQLNRYRSWEQINNEMDNASHVTPTGLIIMGENLLVLWIGNKSNFKSFRGIYVGTLVATNVKFS